MKNWFSLAVVMMLFIPGLSFAEDEVGRFAVVDRVDLKKGAIVLDDQYFILALNAQVVDTTGARTTIYAIKQGAPLYYLLENNKVSKIWLKAAGTPRPADEDD